jgi:hypothetical protein
MQAHREHFSALAGVRRCHGKSVPRWTNGCGLWLGCPMARRWPRCAASSISLTRPATRFTRATSRLKIAKVLEQRTSSLYRALQATGGIESVRHNRSLRVLSFCEREEISRGIAAGNTLRAIAKGLDRAAWASTCRPKTCLLARSPRLQRIEASKLT